jgi:hypothetical protein
LQILKALGLRDEFVQAGHQYGSRRKLRGWMKIAMTSRQRKGSLKKKKLKDRYSSSQGTWLIFQIRNRKPSRQTRKTSLAISSRIRISTQTNDLAGQVTLAGSEIIFAEICAEKGIHVEVHLPLPEAAYIREFVSPGGDTWVERFYKIRSHPLVDEMYQLENLGIPKDGDDPFERNNRWALYSSLIRGIEKVRLIAEWLEQQRKTRRAPHPPYDRVDARYRGVIEQINTSSMSTVMLMAHMMACLI